MDKDSLKHHLKIMANDIIGLEQGLKRLDWLEFEILQIKTHFNQRIKSIRNSICTLLSGISAYGDFEDFFTDFAYASPTSTSYIGNGFQEIVSTAPTVPTVKSVEEIIREVQEMIIELKIKGSVREHRDGLIKFTSTVFGCVYGRTKEEIEKKLQEKIKKFKKKPQKDKKAKIVIPLLSEFYRTEYLPYKIRQGRSESTIYSYESEIKFIIKSKFDKPLHLYKPKQIEDFLYSFPEPRKRQMIQGLLNNIFNRAVTLSLIQTNPCAPIDRAIHSQKQGMAYSFDEILEFLQTLFNHKHLSYSDKCYFIFCLLVGTRRNEALTITVEDVDFKNKILHIRGTKTKGSDRQVPLTPLVEKLLLSLKVKKDKYFPIIYKKAHELFREIWNKKKGHKIHDLRHTFGTIQICVERVDIKTVSLWLGHSAVETTLRTYTHPEQLDRGTFLRGDISETEKIDIYRGKYHNILQLINNFLN